MGGVALGRLWDTHPRLACVLQSVGVVVIGAIFISAVIRWDWPTIAIIGVLLLIDVFSLVAFTRDAIESGWSRHSW